MKSDAVPADAEKMTARADANNGNFYDAGISSSGLSAYGQMLVNRVLLYDTPSIRPGVEARGVDTMQREIIRIEPFDTNFEKWGAPVSTCTRAGDLVFISGLPPFDPATGELLVNAPFDVQAERILEQLKAALETAGSDLDHVLKCNVLCISADRFKAFNAIYRRYFPKNPPARIFFCVPQWTGPFDIEIDCIALKKS